MDKMNILVTVDENYLIPLRTMLCSLFENNPKEQFSVYLLHEKIYEGALDDLKDFCIHYGSTLAPVQIGNNVFSDAPIMRHLTKAMYYRLLAFKVLPQEIDKILYLDPDMLVINPLRNLYDTDLEGYYYAGCAHTGIPKIADQVNKMRLDTYETEGYFNSGVLLMNLRAQRESIDEQTIYSYIREHKSELLLPDQDVLNGLFGVHIKPLDDSLYNYDAHRYETYRAVSSGEKNADWVMKNTVVLHFCGKNKPWDKPSRSRFGMLYKHYEAVAQRTYEAIRHEEIHASI